MNEISIEGFDLSLFVPLEGIYTFEQEKIGQFALVMTLVAHKEGRLE